MQISVATLLDGFHPKYPMNFTDGISYAGFEGRCGLCVRIDLREPYKKKHDQGGWFTLASNMMTMPYVA